MIIYKATNLVNSKVYIGLTTRTFELRKQEHYNHSSKHYNNNVFNRALRKYGFDNFKWEVIDSAKTMEELKEKERKWISYYNSHVNVQNSNGYNVSTGGEGAEGYIQTSEHKRKISNAQKGNKNAVGMKNGKAKLNEKDILMIKSLLSTGISQVEIAKEFNVAPQTIGKIKNGLRWRHILDCEVKIGG